MLQRQEQEFFVYSRNEVSGADWDFIDGHVLHIQANSTFTGSIISIDIQRYLIKYCVQTFSKTTLLSYILNIIELAYFKRTIQ